MPSFFARERDGGIARKSEAGRDLQASQRGKRCCTPPQLVVSRGLQTRSLFFENAKGRTQANTHKGAAGGNY